MSQADYRLLKSVLPGADFRLLIGQSPFVCRQRLSRVFMDARQDKDIYQCSGFRVVGGCYRER